MLTLKANGPHHMPAIEPATNMAKSKLLKSAQKTAGPAGHCECDCSAIFFECLFTIGRSDRKASFTDS